MKITIYYKNGKEVTQDLSDEQRKKILSLIKMYSGNVNVTFSGINKPGVKNTDTLYRQADGLLIHPDREMGLVLNNDKLAGNITKIVLSPQKIDDKTITQLPKADVTWIPQLLRALPQVLVFDAKALRLYNVNSGKPTQLTTDLYQTTTSSKTQKSKSNRQQQPRLSCELVTLLLFASAHPDRQLAILEEGHDKVKPNKAINQWQKYIKQLVGIDIDHCVLCSKDRVKEESFRKDILSSRSAVLTMNTQGVGIITDGNLAGATFPLLKLHEEINQKNTTPLKFWQITLVHPVKNICVRARQAKPLMPIGDMNKKSLDKININATQVISDFNTFKEPGFSAITATVSRQKSDIQDYMRALDEQLGVKDCIELYMDYEDAYKALPAMVKAAMALYQLSAFKINNTLPSNWQDNFKGLTDEQTNQVLAVLVYRDDEGNSLLDKLSYKQLAATGMLNNLDEHGKIKGYTQLWIHLKRDMAKVTDNDAEKSSQAICKIIKAVVSHHHWDTGAVKTAGLKYKTGRKMSVGGRKSEETKFTASATVKFILNKIKSAAHDSEKKDIPNAYTTAVNLIMTKLIKVSREYSQWQDPSAKRGETRSLDSNIMYHQLLDFMEVCQEGRNLALKQQPQGYSYGFISTESSS